MKKVSGLYYGAGTSALHLGIGFLPDKVLLRVIDQAEQEELEWNIQMIRDASAAEGIMRTTIGADDTGLTVLTQGHGVELYYGGDLISAASAQYQVPANSVEAYQGDMRCKGTDGDINAWVLDTTANETGHWNAECNTTYVGVGSVIWIKEDSSGLLKKAAVVALTSNGEAADEVTLSRSLGSGKIERISYLYSFVQCPAGQKMPAGIKINDTTYVNAASQKCLIEAEQFDTNF